MPEFFGWVNVVGDGAIFHQKISGVSFPFGGTFPGGLIFFTEECAIRNCPDPVFASSGYDFSYPG